MARRSLSRSHPGGPVLRPISVRVACRRQGELAGLVMRDVEHVEALGLQLVGLTAALHAMAWELRGDPLPTQAILTQGYRTGLMEEVKRSRGSCHSARELVGRAQDTFARVLASQPTLAEMEQLLRVQARAVGRLVGLACDLGADVDPWHARWQEVYTDACAETLLALAKRRAAA